MIYKRYLLQPEFTIDIDFSQNLISLVCIPFSSLQKFFIWCKAVVYVEEEFSVVSSPYSGAIVFLYHVYRSHAKCVL